jgi:hypothetical protein
VLGLVVLLAVGQSLTAEAQAVSQSPSMRVLPSSGPSAVSLKSRFVTIHLAVSGIRWQVHFGLTRRSVKGQGHVQIYMDKLPARAYKKADLRNLFSLAASSSFSIEFQRAWIKRHRGKHRLLIALAQNNDVLYPGKPASFGVRVK